MTMPLREDKVVETIWTDLIGIDLELKFVRLHDWNVRCLSVGAGEQVLLLHGEGEHLEIYAPMAAALADRFRVTIVDLPAHGFTTTPASPEDVTIETLSNFIAALRHHLVGSEQPINVVASSVSAMAATVFATEHPDALRRLVVNMGRLEWPASQLREWLHELNQLSIALASDVSKERIGAIIRHLLEDAPATAELIEVCDEMYKRPGMVEHSLGAIERLLRSTLEDSALPGSRWREQLGSLSCPVAVTRRRKAANVGSPTATAGPRSAAVLEVDSLLPHWSEREPFAQAVRSFLLGS